MFLLILVLIPLLTLVWLVWMWRRVRAHEARRWLRLALVLAVVPVLAGYLWTIGYRGGWLPGDAPGWMHSLLLLWALVFLPLMAVPMMMAAGMVRAARAAVARSWETRLIPDDPPDPGRRAMLRTTVLALPLLSCYGAAAISVPQRTHFRIRNILLPLPGLPQALSGMTITHISDTHVGKFTRGNVLRDLADATNRLDSDLILLTGDLIDHSLAYLPDAMDMLAAMNPRLGIFNVEGNHDLFQDPVAFAAAFPRRGIPLLRDASAVVRKNGHPVQIMGTAWTRGERRIAQGVDALAATADPDAFPILLSHHPHAFDAAAARGIPLTLAGHTHGGQLMLTPEIGPGPMMFRYWSGLYRRGAAALVVSNGAGNWFPLRTAAPAEIIRITLRRA